MKMKTLSTNYSNLSTNCEQSDLYENWNVVSCNNV